MGMSDPTGMLKGRHSGQPQDGRGEAEGGWLMMLCVPGGRFLPELRESRRDIEESREKEGEDAGVGGHGAV